MYRFISVKENFHLTCKFLGKTSAVWSNHFKNKAPALDSELKCAGMTSCPPASKNIPYISRNSNTPSEGAVAKKTAQVNSGTCIFKEKNTLCVAGTWCLSGYGFALAVSLLLSRFAQSWNCKVQKWVNFYLCLFLGERGTMCLFLILSAWWDLHSSSLSHQSTCCCSVSCWLQQIPRGKIRQGDLSRNLLGDFSLIVYYIAFPWPRQLWEWLSPWCCRQEMGREEGNSGILLGNEKYLSFEVLSFLPSRICIVPAGIEPPHLGNVLVSMWSNLVCALFNTESGTMHFLWGLFCLRDQYNDFAVIRGFMTAPVALQQERSYSVQGTDHWQVGSKLNNKLLNKKFIFSCLSWLYILTCVMHAQVPYLHFILNNFYPLVIKVS